MEKRKGTRNIVVTGFGPFGIHTVNASWSAVELLKQVSETKLRELYNVNLIIEEIPVIYEHVSSRIPEIWKEYDPLFVIHVGVSYKASCLTLETKAFTSGYTRKDVLKQCPKENEILENCLEVGVNVEEICKTVSDKYNCVACASEDAGRYLCEFTLYQSLTVNKDRTLFIHVPDFDVYPTEVTEQGLFSVICCLLERIGADNCKVAID